MPRVAIVVKVPTVSVVKEFQRTPLNVLAEMSWILGGLSKILGDTAFQALTLLPPSLAFPDSS